MSKAHRQVLIFHCSHCGSPLVHHDIVIKWRVFTHTRTQRFCSVRCLCLNQGWAPAELFPPG